MHPKNHAAAPIRIQFLQMKHPNASYPMANHQIDTSADIGSVTFDAKKINLDR